MATYTMALHEVIERRGGTVTWEDGRCRLSGVDIGLDHYPLHKEEHRDDLNGLIVDHYYNREIGVETVEMFTMNLRRRMNEIMPYYNQLYATLDIEFDPLSTIDITTETTGSEQGRSVSSEGEVSGTTETGTSSATTTDHSEGTRQEANESTSDNTTGSTGSSSSEAYEFPQQQLGADGHYATSASKSASESGSTGSSESTSDTATTTEDDSTSETTGTTSAQVDGTVTRDGTGETEAERESTSRTHGYQGNAADMLARFREQILNIDLLIIDDLADLFMIVLDNNDEFSDLERGYAW